MIRLRRLRRFIPRLFIGGFKEIKRPVFPDTFVPLRKNSALTGRARPSESQGRTLTLIEDQPDGFVRPRPFDDETFQ